MNELLERNKQNAVAFYDLMFNQSQPRLAIEKYTGATYIQHNPEVADGKEAFISYFEKMAKNTRINGLNLYALLQRVIMLSYTATRFGQVSEMRIGPVSISSAVMPMARSSNTGMCCKLCRKVWRMGMGCFD